VSRWVSRGKILRYNGFNPIEIDHIRHIAGIGESFDSVGLSDGAGCRGGMDMYLIGICVVGFCVLVFGIIRMRQLRKRRELEEHSVDPETLHELMANRKVLLFDVRQPLDLLAHSEIIPGATRVPPKDVLEQASLIPKEEDSVIYCTCVSEKTSRMILERARALNFTRIKFLKGGLDGWKAKGYPVEVYDKPFHLDTA
jgi:rhodanese-related sulfurtransferase